jgi:hypothetical protein
MDQDRADHVPGFTKARSAWQEEGKMPVSRQQSAPGRNDVQYFLALLEHRDEINVNIGMIF